MKQRNPASSLLVSALALVLVASVHADETTSTIAFSDTSKPGVVKISLGRGDLDIKGADTKEITVRSDAQATGKPRKDGMRVISAATSFALTEKDNVVTLDAMSHNWGKGGDFKLTVPVDTTIIVQNAWGGDFRCVNINGDIEVNSMHGEVKLDNVGGGIVVGTMNGEIHANIRELRENKPLSFTSMNGEVVLRLPESARANVRLRTQNGTVLTDFDEKVFLTKTESVTASRPSTPGNFRNPSTKVIAAEVEEAIREATRISATAVREALVAVKQGLEESRLAADDARRQLEEARQEINRARQENERERRDADRARRNAERNANTNANTNANANAEWTPAPPAAPSPGAAPKPPMVKVPIPTISGGKLVTGTLNGGGPEISVATMNGDVIIRKVSAQP